MKTFLTWGLMGILMIPASVRAQAPETIDPQEAIDACRKLEDTERRLLCYDAIPGATVTGRDELAETVREAAAGVDPALAETDPPDSAEQVAEIPVLRSRMMREWELDDATHGGLLRIRSYRALYLLPARYTTRRNRLPSSPAPGRSVTEAEPLDSIETKFQISFKAKVLDNLIGNNGDMWIGFTQQSAWQAFNNDDSSPFRETNYRPEVFSTWRTGLDLGGIRWQFVGLGFIHESNGRSQPRSRGWNRVYANFGFERGDWQLYLRPWLRVDSDSDDDNPDIEDFLGHGDIRVNWRRNRHELGALIRYNTSTDRGALQLDWHYRLLGDLRGYLQVFTGYGETLIDYNHRQTTIGVGISLVP